MAGCLKEIDTQRASQSEGQAQHTNSTNVQTSRNTEFLLKTISTQKRSLCPNLRKPSHSKVYCSLLEPIKPWFWQ
jgi:hypothetical protein